MTHQPYSPQRGHSWTQLCVAIGLAVAAAGNSPATAAPAGEKQLFIPADVSRVPAGNDYDDDSSEYCYDRMVEGPNVAIFWHKEYGDDPLTNPDERRRFDVHNMLSECERFFDCYVNQLQVVKQGDSISDKYKLLIFVFGGDEGTAFGGGIDDTVGAVWTPAVRVNKPPYGVLAHEMGHSFQFMSRVDSGTGAGGPIGEMSAQYMLWQVYPDWMTFENYHLVDFMKKTHFAFLHPTNMYHSPYVLEYWSEMHGQTFYGELNRQTRPGEDVVATYKRLHDLDQSEFNDEMFDAARRFITWDLARIEKAARPYADQHECALQSVDDGWFCIAPERCPQNYGYNGIRLDVPAAGSTVEVQFRGLAGTEADDSARADKAGWRYGFLAHLQDNRRVYGEVGRDRDGTAAFDVPDETAHLWLVVMGAPTEHSPVAPWGRRRQRSGDADEQQWPYQIKLSGTTLHSSCIEDRSP